MGLQGPVGPQEVKDKGFRGPGGCLDRYFRPGLSWPYLHFLREFVQESMGINAKPLQLRVMYLQWVIHRTRFETKSGTVGIALTQDQWGAFEGTFGGGSFPLAEK